MIKFDVRYTTLFNGNERSYPNYLSDALDNDKFIDFTGNLIINNKNL